MADSESTNSVDTADADPSSSSFSDKFMYKYLSAFLASMRPQIIGDSDPAELVNVAANISTISPSSSLYPNYYDEYESNSDRQSFDFDYSTNAYDSSPASPILSSTENFLLDSISSSSSNYRDLEHAGDLEWNENITNFPDWVSKNFFDGNYTDVFHYPLPLPHTVAIILAGTILSILTTGGNLMVIMSFKLEKQLQTISNYFLFSLAVADLTIGVISIPLMTFYTAEGQWTLGYTTCQFWLSIDYLMSNASVMNLLLISFDRYFSVTRPLTYRPRRTSKKAMIMIAATFITSLLLWPPLIIAWPYIEARLYWNIRDPLELPANECIVQFLKTNSFVTLCTATVAFYGPVIIMIILYSRVYYVTKTRQREIVKLQAFHQQSVRRSDDKLTQSMPQSAGNSGGVAGGHGGGAPIQRTVSSSLIRKTSNYLKNRPATDADETDLITKLNKTTSNNNASFRSRGPSDSRKTPASKVNSLQKIEIADVKPWGIQALLEHFSRAKQVTNHHHHPHHPCVQLGVGESSTSPRKGSLASSGFEEDDSFMSMASGENTTGEAYPLRSNVKIGGQLIHGHHLPVSPTPSDYGSTLANQFVNHVRQSFMIKRKPCGERARHFSLVPTTGLLTTTKRSSKRMQSERIKERNETIEDDGKSSADQQTNARAGGGGQSGQPDRSATNATSTSRHPSTSKRHHSRLTNKPSGSTMDPTQSPIQELRRLAKHSTSSSVGHKSASRQQSRNVPSEASTPQNTQSTAYTVLIELGTSAGNADESPCGGDLTANTNTTTTEAEIAMDDRSPPVTRAGSSRRNSWRGSRPIITLHENAAMDQTYLSPERAISVSKEDEALQTAVVQPSSILTQAAASLNRIGSHQEHSRRIRDPVRRLSSCSSAVSGNADTNSAGHAATGGVCASPLVISNRGISIDNDSGQNMPAVGALSSRLALSMGGIASRISSMRGFGPEPSCGGGGVGGAGAGGQTSTAHSHSSKSRHSYQRRKRGERRQQESKAARTLSAILLAFILTWTPYNLIVCIESFHSGTVPDFWFTFSYYLCYLNSTINPILYALCNATFRRTFWRILTCKWTPVKPSHRPSSHHAAAAIAAVAVAAANRRQSATTIAALTMRPG